MKSLSYNRHATNICQGSNGYVRTDQLASASKLRAMSAAGKLFVPPPVETIEAPVAEVPLRYHEIVSVFLPLQGLCY